MKIFIFFLDLLLFDENFFYDELVVEGENVIMNCVVKESNFELNIMWVKLSDCVKVFLSGVSLSLCSVLKDDEGEYCCLVENGIGEQMMLCIVYFLVEGQLFQKFYNLIFIL